VPICAALLLNIDARQRETSWGVRTHCGRLDKRLKEIGSEAARRAKTQAIADEVIAPLLPREYLHSFDGNDEPKEPSRRWHDLWKAVALTADTSEASIKHAGAAGAICEALARHAMRPYQFNQHTAIPKPASRTSTLSGILMPVPTIERGGAPFHPNSLVDF